jgi:gamma-butyrobetaine dioxygenase
MLKTFWDDGHRGEYPMKWLRENCYTPKPNAITDTNFHGMRNKVTLWSKQDLKGGMPPMVDYSAIMKDDEGLLLWLQQLENYGISLVKNVPTSLGSIKKVVKRICYLRPTMYGEIFDVQSVPKANNVAYTNVKLDIHQDLW